VNHIRGLLDQVPINSSRRQRDVGSAMKTKKEL